MREEDTNWIWLTSWERSDDEDAGMVYFRKKLIYRSGMGRMTCRISADSRYKLYVNSCFVQEGPAKGDLETWYADPADVTPYLSEGENAVCVEVLRYPEARNLRNHSLYRTNAPCLYIEDTSENKEKLLDGRTGWRVRKAEHVHLLGETTVPAPLHILEDACGDETFAGWMTPSYSDDLWEEARPYRRSEIRLADAPFHLKDRPIPMLEHQDKSFVPEAVIREAKGRDAKTLKEAWERMLEKSEAVCIPERARVTVEFSAAVLSCGYPILCVSGGAGSRIHMEKAESYAYPKADESEGCAPRKGDRTDREHGQVIGQTDHYCVGGYGTEGIQERYETFWYRTFRVYRITVETGETPLKIHSFTYRTIEYPLKVRTSFTCSDPSFPAIWDISLRTLERCMKETYMDCPYYEQLQYAMDARSEILFTYCVSADDRLARQCMEDLRRSQRKDGMINSCAPNIRSNPIPGFAVFYILMLYDHMMYFGDQELLKDHFPAVEQILRFFEKHRSDKGLVGKVGGPGGQIRPDKYWSFIDWAKEWNATGGVPTAVLQGDGSLTMESLYYCYGLQHAAKLARFLERPDEARQWEEAAEEVRDCIRKWCCGSRKDEQGNSAELIQDGPGVEEYSVHCQVFAVLTGTVSVREGRRMLQATVGNPQFPQASVSFMFYLFRALEQVGLYGEANQQWELWRRMVRNHLTTCVENDTDERSDCHAWASTLLYEMPSVYLGVQPAEPGYRSARIAPVPGHLTWAKGTVVTPRGNIQVSWKQTKEGLQCEEKLPEGMRKEDDTDEGISAHVASACNGEKRASHPCDIPHGGSDRGNHAGGGLFSGRPWKDHVL